MCGLAQQESNLIVIHGHDICQVPLYVLFELAAHNPLKLLLVDGPVAAAHPPTINQNLHND